MAVAPEEVQNRKVRRRLAIRHRGAFENQPARCVVGVDALVDEARLPHTRLADHGHYLPLAGARTLQGVAEGGQLGVPSDKTRVRPAHDPRLEATPQRTGTKQLPDSSSCLRHPPDGVGDRGR